MGNFSKASFGESSEESRIVKSWNDLIEEAQIIDKQQLISDFANFLNVHWPCKIVGCYLSKYLDEPRHALKVFELLTKSVLYNAGTFQIEEDEMIIQHIEAQNGKYDLHYLKAQLNRPRYSIGARIEALNVTVKRGHKFTIDEDTLILKHVLGTNITNGLHIIYCKQVL